jgi:hypothetical protein
MEKFLLLTSISLLILCSSAFAQVPGCTDPLANNYNPTATVNDGSCTYNASAVSPSSSVNLVNTLSETSGIIKWNNQLWTHNDSDDINLYALDTLNGSIKLTQPLPGTENIDWEEISQDSGFVYVGDFGNNLNGNRTDLKILKISKSSLLSGSPSIEIINFSYSNQLNFTPTGANNTDFDCEAFIVSSDSIFLFTKQWVSNKTGLYALSKQPGTHVAKYKSTYNVQGLITGAVYKETENLIALSGYSVSLQPFIYLLYDFRNHNFFTGNKRKISLSLPFHQVEGIATTEGLKYYLTNEKFFQQPISIVQKLHTVDLTEFLEDYLNSLLTTSVTGIEKYPDFEIYPVPAKQFVNVRTGSSFLPVSYFMTNQLGQIVLTGKLTDEISRIDISGIPAGIYIFKIKDQIRNGYKLIIE